MIEKITITPKFEVERWARESLNRDWFEIQAKVEVLGRYLHMYMQNYIKTHTARSGSTGRLEKAINYEKFGGFGLGEIGFGIGNIQQLQSLAPYWYVINYGKKVTGERFTPGGGKYRPIKFGGQNADPSLRGRAPVGAPRASMVIPIGGGKVPSFIRPIFYIQATGLRMQAEINTIVTKGK